MIKKPFNPEKVVEIKRFKIGGRLRVQLYLYMEDNDCTISEAIRDGIRAITASQAEQYKKGRRPETK